ncbi:MAG: protein-L-isoaspartate O-methyltransferase [Rhizobiaceae bacterium]|nr:protein-L-isoaspartate O-methyltransferase [Rhizobiaceae bacterium]
MNEYYAARKTMTDCQIRPSGVTDLTIIDAMQEIPRENFVADLQKPLAYIDEDLPLKFATNSTGRFLIEPATFARLIQLAEIQPGSIVLDIGCATGYSTAVLSRLCSSVVALEEDVTLAKLASDNLAELEIDNAVIVTGPLSKGYSKEGPFDAIIIAGGVEKIDDELLNQLKNGGKLVTVLSANKPGRAVRYLRDNDNFTMISYFDSSVSSLPGFEKSKEFVF